MWNASEPTANLLFSISNWLIIGGALASLIGAIGSFSMSSRREYFADERAKASDVEIAKAGAAAAVANERAVEAETRLQRLWMQTGQRIVDRERFLTALGDEPRGIVEIEYGEGDQDSWSLSLQLRNLVNKAGWSVSKVTPVSMSEILKQVITIPMNVKVIARTISDEETQAVLELSVGRTASPRTPYVVMLAALMAGLQRGAVGGSDASLPDGTLRLVIGPR